MTNAISTASQGVTSAATSSSAAASAASPALGQDAFLKLLVAQLNNQDPTAPVQGTEFVTQLSQFSLVEQSVAQSGTLTTINNQLSTMGNNQATALIGKQVATQQNTLAFNGVLATSSSVTLAGPAAAVTATITDSAGNAVRTINVGAKSAGVATITWDGKTDAGQAAPQGTYTMNVSATDSSGSAVQASQAVGGVVTGVTYANGAAQVTLDNGAVEPLSSVVSVSSAPTTTSSGTSTP